MSQRYRANIPIQAALPAERRAALELALSSRGVPPPPAVIDRAYDEAQRDAAEWRGLLVARVAPPDSALPMPPPFVGAAWLRTLPGRVSSVTAPQTAAEAPEGTGAALLCEAANVAQARDSAFVQALAEADDARARADFTAAGFEHPTDLLFLVAECQSGFDEPPRADLEWLAYRPERHRRLADLVERTYIDSRDCPQLDGVRAIDDVLAGYRATGQFDPDRWLIAVENGRDVGCLLLADHPHDDQWELVYLGVTPEFRGRGYGSALTHHALSMARRASRARVVLAVDAANRPAIEIYRRSGFETWERRAIYLRRFDNPREM